MVCGECHFDGKRKQECFDAGTGSHLPSDEKMKLVHSTVQIEFSNIKIASTKTCRFDARIHRFSFKPTPQTDFFVGLFLNPRFFGEPIVFFCSSDLPL